MNAKRWLQDIRRLYESNDAEAFASRLAGWRGTADRVVLTYAVLAEVRRLRRVVERLVAKGGCR
jgi:hypothetical protein